MANEAIDSGFDSIEVTGAPQLNPAVDAIIGGDVIPPVVENVLPATNIIEPNDLIQFDVVDETSLSYHTIFAEYPGLEDFDVIWTGYAFTPKYSTSSRTATTGGWTYSILRDDGWRTSPNIHVHVVDGGGNLDI